MSKLVRVMGYHVADYLVRVVVLTVVLLLTGVLYKVTGNATVAAVIALILWGVVEMVVKSKIEKTQPKK